MNEDMVLEILGWWKRCVRTGTVCCTTSSEYLNKYPLEYNEAMRRYNKEKLNEEYPIARTVRI